MADLETRWNDWVGLEVRVYDLDGNPALDVACDVIDLTVLNSGESVGSLDPTSAVFALRNDDGKYDPETIDGITGEPLVAQGYEVQIDAVDQAGGPGPLTPLFRGWIDNVRVDLEAGELGVGSIAEVVAYDAVASLSAHRLETAVPEVGDGDDLAARVGRVLTEIAWPGATDLTPGGPPLVATSFGGSAGGHIRAAAQSTGGVVFMSRDGKVTNLFPALGAVAGHLWARTGGVGTPTPGVPNVCVASPLDVDNPLATVVNDVSLETTAGLSANAEDAASKNKYSVRSISLGGLWTRDLVDLQALAASYVQGDPTPDLASVDLYVEDDPAMVQVLMEVTVGDRYLFTFDNGSGYDFTLDLLVTGFTASFTRDTVVGTIHLASPFKSIAGTAQDATSGTDHNHDGRYMEWAHPWLPGDYFPDQVVTDDGWLMVANKATNDRPAPQPNGPAVPAYPTDPPAWTPPLETTVSFLGTATRFVFLEGGWLETVRAYIPEVSGSLRYVLSVYDQTDPDRVIHTSTSITPTAPGWFEIEIARRVVLAGTDLVIALYTQETAGSILRSYDWDYQGRTNTNTDPGVGNFNRDVNAEVLRVNKTDDSAADRGAELLAIVPGTEITVGGGEWTVQVLSVTDQGTWVEYGVETQAGGLPNVPDGVRTLEWLELSPQPTPYVAAPLWWDTNQPTWATVSGIYSEEPLSAEGQNVTTLGTYVNPDDVTLLSTEHATGYGVDLNFQPATVSDDWDPLAFTSQGSSGGGGGGDGFPHIVSTDEPLDPEPFTVWVNPDEPGELEYLPLIGGIIQPGPLRFRNSFGDPSGFVEAFDTSGRQILRLGAGDNSGETDQAFLEIIGSGDQGGNSDPTFGFRVGGVSGLNVHKDSGRFPDGSASRPGIGFQNSAQVGLIRTGGLGIVTGGAKQLDVESGGGLVFKPDLGKRYRVFANVSDTLDFGLSIRDVDDNEAAQFRGTQTYIKPVYDSTTASAANVSVGSDGRLRRSTSSRRYKYSIRPTPKRFTAAALAPVSFTVKDPDGVEAPTKHLGFIAEDLAEIDPRIVEYGPDGEVEGYDVRAVVAVLAAQVNDLRARLEEVTGG